MAEPDIRKVFGAPPREFGMMPFWFWNDELEEQELLRQVRAFNEKGFGGFVLHPRIGLSRRIGYLTSEYFRLVRLVIEESARLGLHVILYDEASYPSGSACGKVVVENPAFAARCLIPVSRPVNGPKRAFWRPNSGRGLCDRLVAVIKGKETAPNCLSAETLEVLTTINHELVRCDVPDGAWQLMSFWSVFSGGVIRGAFPEEEEDHAHAPAAADIMNPDAVACFIRLTHEQYFTHLKEFFGTTIVGMFTDEPKPMGKTPRRGPNVNTYSGSLSNDLQGGEPKPYTEGLLDDVKVVWGEDPIPCLPCLWMDCGMRTVEFRQAYDMAVRERIKRVFYKTCGQWCESHGIAFTGHPRESNEMGTYEFFQWPGQDTVLRLVEIGGATALEGPDSTASKVASSAAALRNCSRNAIETFGAYGWHLTLDEAKWLLDWHFVRGSNLIIPHACYYSIEGRRAFESEPDVGIHNVWWPYFHVLSDYSRRMSWLLSDGIEVCDVAIYTQPYNVAWNVARYLLERQVDFLYVDDSLLENARVESDRLCVGRYGFRTVICDPPDAIHPSLIQFKEQGGLVIDKWAEASSFDSLCSVIRRDITLENCPDVRAIHYAKSGWDFYILVNEGEKALESSVCLRTTGCIELWNPMDGSVRPWPAQVNDGRLRTSIWLDRRQAVVLAVIRGSAPVSHIPRYDVPGPVVQEVKGPWCVTDENRAHVDVPCPGNWAQAQGWETFSGRIIFETQFEALDVLLKKPLFLDLGCIGDIAEVFINEELAGTVCWQPYVLDISSQTRAGSNSLRVRVTNSMANAYDGRQMPSGLMGPVVLREGIDYHRHNLQEAKT